MIHRSGQAALIVMMIVIVGFTLAVGIAARSVTTVSISTQEQEHARSFSAAEAGIEDALRQQNLSVLLGAAPTIAFGESSVSYQVTRLTSATTTVNPGEIITVDWTSGTETSVNVSWSGCAQLSSTAIQSSGSIARAVTANSPASFVKGANQLVRLRLINCAVVPAPVTISGTTGGTLSFYKIDSLGTSVNSQVSSRIQAVRSELAAPSLMDYAIFSGGNIQ